MSERDQHVQKPLEDLPKPEAPTAESVRGGAELTSTQDSTLVGSFTLLPAVQKVREA